MRVHAKIQKWGNGLALRISGVMREMPRFQEGTEIEVEVSEQGFSVTKSQSMKTNLFPFSEAQLLQGLTDVTAHADLLARPLASEIEWL